MKYRFLKGFKIYKGPSVFWAFGSTLRKLSKFPQRVSAKFSFFQFPIRRIPLFLVPVSPKKPINNQQPTEEHTIFFAIQSLFCQRRYQADNTTNDIAQGYKHPYIIRHLIFHRHDFPQR
jgi:hypothetical protein